MIINEKNETVVAKHNRGTGPKWMSVQHFLHSRTLLFLAVLGMLAYPGWYYWNKMQAQHQGDLPLRAVATNNANENGRPSENKPNVAEDTYEVPIEHPRRIIIDNIDVNGFVQSVGTNKNNAVDVPNNVHVAGWYDQSVPPGNPGLSIIDGHVSGRYVDGIFYRLHKLKPGDTFQIEYGDRSIKSFEVIDVKQLPEAESAKFLFTKNSAVKAQVNLITCGGDFNSKTEQYADRIIVVAKLLDS